MPNSLKTTLLLSLLTVLLVLMGSAIGGQTGMVVAFLVALAGVAPHHCVVQCSRIVNPRFSCHVENFVSLIH